MIVGNEPNLNRFWLPQFGLDGTSAAPAAYLALLAQTYDALKAVSPEVRVYGGAVSPRGSDRPGRRRARRTRRRRSSASSEPRIARAAAIAPVMDAFVIHPYARQLEPVARHRAPELDTTIGVADYGKLVALLGEAFDGTAQPGSELPIFYGEFGVESEIPAAKASLYTGTEPTTTKPVSESTQAAYYEQALALAFCQPTVGGMLLFLSRDERARAAWQSGIHYVDGTPKTSRARVTEVARPHDRRLDHALPGRAAAGPGDVLRFGTRSAAKRGVFKVALPLRPRLPLLGAARERASRTRRSSRRRARPRSASSSRPISGRVD